MKRWESLKEHLETGEWHSHTNYSECGKNTVMEMCRQAHENNLTMIAITEHVRKETDYNWNSLKKEVEEARSAFPNLKIILGCEAKVLGTNGELDIQPELKKSCELLIGVFHGFPTNDKEPLLEAALNMLNDPLLDIFGHSMTLLDRCDPPLTDDEIITILEKCKKNNVLVEISKLYPGSHQLNNLIKKSGVQTIRGSDAHKTSDIRKI